MAVSVIGQDPTFGNENGGTETFGSTTSKVGCGKFTLGVDGDVSKISGRTERGQPYRRKVACNES